MKTFILCALSLSSVLELSFAAAQDYNPPTEEDIDWHHLVLIYPVDVEPSHPAIFDDDYPLFEFPVDVEPPLPAFFDDDYPFFIPPPPPIDEHVAVSSPSSIGSVSTTSSGSVFATFTASVLTTSTGSVSATSTGPVYPSTTTDYPPPTKEDIDWYHPFEFPVDVEPPHPAVFDDDYPFFIPPLPPIDEHVAVSSPSSTGSVSTTSPGSVSATSTGPVLPLTTTEAPYLTDFDWTAEANVDHRLDYPEWILPVGEYGDSIISDIEHPGNFGRQNYPRDVIPAKGKKLNRVYKSPGRNFRVNATISKIVGVQTASPSILTYEVYKLSSTYVTSDIAALVAKATGSVKVSATLPATVTATSTAAVSQSGAPAVYYVFVYKLVSITYVPAGSARATTATAFTRPELYHSYPLDRSSLNPFFDLETPGT
jgi:hypothetical protein